MAQILEKSGLVVGLFEPGNEMFISILGLLDADSVQVPLKSRSKEESIRLIYKSDLPYLHGAFVGNFGGVSKDMRSVVDAIQTKFPHAWTVGMVEKTRFRTGADQKVDYRYFADYFDSILAQMIANANKPTFHDRV